MSRVRADFRRWALGYGLSPDAGDEGNAMEWYSTADSSFGADVGAPPGGGFALNVFLRDGDTVYRTWTSTGRGTEQLSHTFALIDVLPWGAPRGMAGLT